MNQLHLKNRYKFNKKMICFVFILVLISGIGFAYIQSTFSINGTADIKNGAWNVHFTSIKNINNYDLIDINRKIKDTNKSMAYYQSLIEEYEAEIIRLNGLYETCTNDVPGGELGEDIPVIPEDPVPVANDDDSSVTSRGTPSIEYEGDCFELDQEIYSLQSAVESYEYYIQSDQEVLVDLNNQKTQIAPLIAISDDAKSISIPLELSSRLDFLEFEVDVVNEGKYDAMVADYVLPVLPNDLNPFITLEVTYLNGDKIQNNDLLASGATKTLKVKYSFKSDYENTTTIPIGKYDITYSLPYIQATKDAIDRG